MLVGALVVLLGIVAAGTGALRDFKDGDAPGVDLLPRVLVCMFAGAAVGLAVVVVVRSLGPDRAGRLGMTTSGALVLVMVIGGLLGGIAGIAITPLGPPISSVQTVVPTTTRVEQPTSDTLPDGPRYGLDIPPWVGTIIVIIALIMLFLVILGVSRSFQMPRLRLRGGLSWGQRRNSTVLQEDLDLDAAADSFDESAGALDDDEDPRAAIIAAYVRLLAGLEAAGCARQAAEAPEEHLRRSLGDLGVRPEHMRVVVDKFLVARFSTHPMTIADRDEVRAALREAADQLRAVAAARAAEAAAEPVAAP